MHTISRSLLALAALLGAAAIQAQAHAHAQGAPATAPKVPPSQRLHTSHGMQNDQIAPTPAPPGSRTDHLEPGQKEKGKPVGKGG